MKNRSTPLLGGLLAFALLFACIVCPSVARAGEDLPIVVSLGDSYSSGEGLPPYGTGRDLAAKVEDPDWLAHRSQVAWPGRLTVKDGTAPIPLADLRDENWYFSAVSGASTRHIFDEDQKKSYHKGSRYQGEVSLPPQARIFDTLAGQGKKADYVTLTIGGNDAEFGKIVQTVTLSSGYLAPNAVPDKLKSLWDKFYDPEKGIREDIRSVYEQVLDAAGEQAHLIVVGYPELFDRNGEGLPAAKNEAAAVNAAVRRFNDELRRLVNLMDDTRPISFVSVEEAFRGHEAYSKDPYILPITLPARGEDLNMWAIKSDASMHPNDKGAQAYAACVQAELDRLEELRSARTTEAPTPTTSPAQAPTGTSLAGLTEMEIFWKGAGLTQQILYEDSRIADVSILIDEGAADPVVRNGAYEWTLNGNEGLIRINGEWMHDAGLVLTMECAPDGLHLWVWNMYVDQHWTDLGFEESLWWTYDWQGQLTGSGGGTLADGVLDALIEAG